MPTTPVGGGVDGPNYADYFDSTDAKQLAAASTNLRQILHIVQNTDVLFITQMGGELQTYNSQPSNPTLSPVVILRKDIINANLDETKQQEMEYKQYLKFINDLPPDLRHQLKINQALPQSQRDEKLIAFDETLRSMAELSVWATGFNKTNAATGAGPSSIALLRMASAAQNGVQVLENTHAKLKAEWERMPEIDPNRVVLGEFLMMLSRLIGAAKNMIQAMQTSDAEKDKDYSIAQRESAAAKLTKQLEVLSKVAEAKAKQSTMDLVMKITGPIIAVLALAATILSGGTVGALMIAVISTALSVADSASGFMTQGMQKFMDSLPAEWRDVVMIVLVVAVILAARGAGSAKLSPMLGKKATEEATKKAAESCANMAAMQAGMMMMTTSGVLTSVSKSIAKLIPANEQDSEIIAMVIQLLLMLIMGILAGKFMGGIDMTKGAMLCDIVSDSMSAGTRIFSAVSKLKLGMLAKEKLDIQASIALLENALETFGLSKKEIAAARKQLNELAQLWADLFNMIIQKEMQINTSLAQAG